VKKALILRSVIIILLTILSLSYAAYAIFSEGKVEEEVKDGMPNSKDAIIEKGTNEKHDNSKVQEIERILEENGTNEKHDDSKAQEVEKIFQENGISIDTEINVEENEYILSRRTALALYDQGYDFYDIEIAKELALFCTKTPLELLQIKGKSVYVSSEDEAQGKVNIENQSKSWAEVVEELGIKLEKPVEALGIPDEKISELKQQNLDDNEIEAVFAMAYNFQKDYREIASELKRGSTIEELEKRYTEERESESRQKRVDAKIAKKNTEKILINKYQITDKDIEKCKKHGITNLVDIAFAKSLAKKSNMNLDQILELKNEHKQWNRVAEKAGVTER